MFAGRSRTRREWLAAFVQLAGMGLSGLLAAIAAAAAWPPGDRRARPRWRRAARLDALTPHEPHRVVVWRPRDQGWFRERAPEVVYLVWDGQRALRALSAVCTHLGCRVVWDAGTRRFQCPCHGGAYSPEGAVVAGPPPRPLAAIDARLDPSTGEVWVWI
jgi:Rieske Fe-S protein